MKSKVFIIVGHSNWGKSETLAKLNKFFVSQICALNFDTKIRE